MVMASFVQRWPRIIWCSVREKVRGGMTRSRTENLGGAAQLLGMATIQSTNNLKIVAATGSMDSGRKRESRELGKISKDNNGP